LIIHKLNINAYQLIFFIKNIPLRLSRIFLHFKLFSFYKKSIKAYEGAHIVTRTFYWIIELILLILDALGVFVFYEILSEWIKWNIRDMNAEEIQLVRDYCPSLLAVNKIIRIDHKAFLGPSWKSFAYVSFHTINVWNTIHEKTFVHELIHLYQYQKEGPVYILRALHAQVFGSGYQYGGIKGLIEARNQGKEFSDFNYEQQGDILADFYTLKHSVIYDARKETMLQIYQNILRDIRSDDHV